MNQDGPPPTADVELSPDTMKILIATDVHLGYMEKDGVRGKDAMNSFEEVLQIAEKNNVDFVLLGGDLFHENKPSRTSMQGAIELLRKYCLGDKPCQVEFLSDPAVNFGHTAFPTVNYTDPNFNVAMPVFSIHGNHDDPAGQGNYCSLDLLHAAGLVNYFGKCLSLDAVEMSPLLLEKGATKLALYGLGAMRDERLHRLFCKKAVRMLRPREHHDDWFNLLVLHQNRARHGQTNYIPEQFLDDFLDLVIWGHEHECLVEPAWNGTQNFYITQPGSTVATSLSEGETREKHCALLLVNGRNFKLRKIRLETVRQFYLEEIVLADTEINPGDPDAVRKVEKFCGEKVQALLNRAEQERISQQHQPDKPLIRLKIDYSGGFDLFSTHRFGQKFVDRVANPKDLVLFHRRRAMNLKDTKLNKSDDVTIDIKAEALDSTRVEDMVREYFQKADKAKQLQVLTERGMSDAIKEFVDKEERDAISELAKHQIKKTQDYLRTRNVTEDTFDLEVQRFKEERRRNLKQEDSEVQEVISRVRASRPAGAGDSDDDGVANRSRGDDDDEGNGYDEDDMRSPVTTSRGRGRGSRGRGDPSTRRPARGRGSRGGRGAAAESKSAGGRGANSKSIKDAFAAVPSSNSNSRWTSTASKAHAISSDEECSIIEDDDDDDSRVYNKKSKTSTSSRDFFNVASNSSRSSSASSRPTPSTSGASKSKARGKGVAFDSDSDPDEDDSFDRSIPQRKRKR